MFLLNNIIKYSLILILLTFSHCGWANDISPNQSRPELVQHYLNEFCSISFPMHYPKTYKAIQHVLNKIPDDVFLAVTERRRPILFTEYHTTGIGRFANSSEIFVLPDDVPAFQDGMTIIKLSAELESADSSQAIEGVIAHELAHRFLEHILKKTERCQREKEANHLIQDWGFAEEFELARKKFGRKDGVKSGCEETKPADEQ